MRTELKRQTVISVRDDNNNPHQFTIVSLIGQGATCCVYEADHNSNGKAFAVRIKELYPAYAKITRSGQDLCWSSSQERDAAIAAFEEAAEKQLKFQNDADTGNSTVHLSGIYSGNNTKYLVMAVDHGKTFDQDTSISINDILKTVLALTKVVGKYHNAGYLHLDIKPENFLIIDETRELVKIFDTDTVTKISDITEGRVKSIPNSLKWAAPEQIQQKLSKICAATDIYSIGAVLFERIMGRAVENEDIGIFADWTFDKSPCDFDTVNPKIMRMLREIFRKTLAASVKRRCQSTVELQEMLQDAIDITQAGAPFIRSKRLRCPVHFVGREQELIEIHKAFESGTHAVFIRGMGGIGKTELALQYAAESKREYDTIIFCNYRQTLSLKRCLEEIEIVNYDEEEEENAKFKHRLNKLGQCCDEHMLIIVDNFDTETDSNLRELLSLRANLLFTTKNNFMDIDGAACQIELGCLPDEQLVTVFERHYGQRVFESENETLISIFRAVENYTLIIPILAKQLIASGITLETMKATLFAEREKIIFTKDGEREKITNIAALRMVFNSSGLSEDEKQVLRNMWVLDRTPYGKQEYREWTLSAGLDPLNNLIGKNWVQYDQTNDRLSLHTVINEMVGIDLDPGLKRCAGLSEYIDRRLQTLSYNNDSREWSINPRMVFCVYTKWFEAEHHDETKEKLFIKTARTLEKYLEFVNGDTEQLCYKCFDEAFSPLKLFDLLCKGNEIRCDAAGAEWKDILLALPKEEQFHSFWPLVKPRLDNALMTVQEKIQILSLYIRTLYGFEEVMNEWGIWDSVAFENEGGLYDDDEIDAEAKQNWERMHQTLDEIMCQLTKLIADYDDDLDQLCNYMEDQPLIDPKNMVQYYLPVIWSWCEMINDLRIIPADVPITKLYHVIYETMKHTLILLDEILDDMGQAGDWGDYNKLKMDLVDWMSRIVCRVTSAHSGDLNAASLDVGFELLSCDTLLSYSVPDFPSN